MKISIFGIKYIIALAVACTPFSISAQEDNSDLDNKNLAPATIESKIESSTDADAKKETPPSEDPKQTTISTKTKSADADIDKPKPVQVVPKKAESEDAKPKAVTPKVELTATQVPTTLSITEKNIVRARFTTGIKNKDPIDELSETGISAGITKLFFFTDLRDLKGQKLIHRWSLDGKLSSEVKFEIGGNRWRVWSSKELKQQQPGKWTVEIISGSGQVVVTKAVDLSKGSTEKIATPVPKSETQTPKTTDTIKPAKSTEPVVEKAETKTTTTDNTKENSNYKPIRKN